MQMIHPNFQQQSEDPSASAFGQHMVNDQAFQELLRGICPCLCENCTDL